VTCQVESRVAVQIFGGLGNQLFEYAAGRSLANRLGARLILDCTPRMANTRKFALDRFSIQAAVILNAPAKIRSRYFRREGSDLGRWVTNTFHNVFPCTVQIDGHRFKVIYERQHLTYDPRFDILAGSIYLTGWWQSYRYFENAANVLRSELRMHGASPRANGEWLDRIRKANSVCLHVRRGDYLDSRNYFGLCTPSYYARAVQIIRERIESPSFFVFSDDLTWCRDQLSMEAMQFVDANGPDDAAAELQLMATCRHHILANSSLSWWAAWLGDRPEQIVIAPDPWFAGGPPARDLLPKRWIRLPPGY
jgi:Glycosyl transferase family 11